MPFVPIEIGDFLVIAEYNTGIDARVLARDTRLMSLAQSALAAPFSGFGEVELFPTLSQKAAVYAARIVTYHPLPDGNKRAGYDTMREFVARNGAEFAHPAGDLMATAQMLEDLAAGLVTEPDFVAWVIDRVRPATRVPAGRDPAQ